MYLLNERKKVPSPNNSLKTKIQIVTYPRGDFTTILRKFLILRNEMT